MPVTRSSRSQKVAEMVVAPAMLKGQVASADPQVMPKKSRFHRKAPTYDAQCETVAKGFSSRPGGTEGSAGLKKTGKSSDVPLNSDGKSARKGLTSVHAEIENEAGFEHNDFGQDAAVHTTDSCTPSAAANARKRKSNIKPPPVTQKRSRRSKKVLEKEEAPNSSDTNVGTSHNQGGNIPKLGKSNIKEQAQRKKTPSTEKKQVKSSGRPPCQPSKQTNIQIREESSTIAAAVTVKGIVEMGNTNDNMMDSITVVTEDSSTSDSDSDFEEVPFRFRTPESSYLSSTHSDSGFCHKLENSSSESSKSSQNASESFTSTSSTSFSSPPWSTEKSDSCGNGRAQSKASSNRKKNLAENPPAESARKTGNKSENQGEKKRLVNSGKVSDKCKPGACISPKKETNTETGEVDIMAVLMKMEGQPVNAHGGADENQPSTSGHSTYKNKSGRKNTSLSTGRDDSDSIEESDWEEVEDYKQSPVKSQIPDAPVQITIDDPGMMRRKRKKKEFDWQAYVRRRIKRLAREIQVDMHKVNLLCLLSHGMQQNSICNDVTLCATALSVVPPEQLRKSVAKFDSASLLVLVKWFRSTFCLAKICGEDTCAVVSSSRLTEVIRDYTANEPRLLVMVLVAMLRAMGFNVRLVMSLQPVPLKLSLAATSKAAPKRKKGDNSEANSVSSKKSTRAAGNQKTTKSSSAKSTHSKLKASKSINEKTQQAKPAEKPKRKGRKLSRKTKTPDRDVSSSDDDDLDGPSRPKRRMSARPKKSVKPSSSSQGNGDENDESGDDYQPSSASDASNFSDEEEVVKKKRKQSSKGKGNTASKQSSHKKVAEDEQSDAEFDSSFSVRSLTEQRKKANGKVQSPQSSPDRSAESKAKTGRDCWLEVFLPAESKWVCVDCMRSTVGKPYDIGAAASQPLVYVLGFENDGSVKDITAKYAPRWLSHTRKQRVESVWWRESLQPYASTNEELDNRENESIKAHLMQRPLPTSIQDFKNHPLYALQRHLLKYEAIYPESSIPVGYIRQEPVYARECVHTLHSRDNWLREARVVRLGETAYKRVKSIKRWTRLNNPEELDLELFGYWQTEEYIPPPAVNGKVPKNEYGNVELFLPSMLPSGTVHVRVPALNRVARKLGIDIAAAMTGWDNHCGFSHPVLDGWVVCEEHKEILLAAWEEDQELQKQKEIEKREKRVLSNWTTLARGLLIKDKLKKKFNLEDKTAEPKVKKEVKSKKGEVATDVQHAWPAKQQHRQKGRKEKPQPQPSHFSVESM